MWFLKVRQYTDQIRPDNSKVLAWEIPCQTMEDHDVWLRFIRGLEAFCNENNVIIGINDTIGPPLKKWTHYGNAHDYDRLIFLVQATDEGHLQLSKRIYDAMNGFIHLENEKQRVSVTGVNVFSTQTTMLRPGEEMKTDDFDDEATVTSDDDIEIQTPNLAFRTRDTFWKNATEDWNGGSGVYSWNPGNGFITERKEHDFYYTYRHKNVQKNVDRAVRLDTPETFVHAISKLVRAVVCDI